ncbi:MAG: serine hydrolase domain-containing protein [Planctomycetota bacterium]
MHESQQWPSTTAGRLAQTLISLIDSGYATGDQDELAAFYREVASDNMQREFSADNQAEWLMQLRRDTGPLRLRSITNSGGGFVESLLHTGDAETLVRFTLVESGGKIDGLLFEPVASSELSPAASRPESVEEILRSVQQATGVPGLAAAVYFKSELAHSAAIGVQEVGSDRPVRVDDAFHVGSLAKSMTAAVIASLVHNGDLSWDATVSELNPDLGATSFYASITLRELLQHAAGLPAMTAPGEDIDAAIANVSGTPLEQRREFARILVSNDAWAGTRGRFVYSNAGYALAAHLAEHVSGRSWEDLVGDAVFSPVGMETAGFGWPASPDEPRRVRGHVEVEGELATLPFGEYELESFMAPAGDVHCSVIDLAKWGNVQVRGFASDAAPFDLGMLSTLHTPDFDETYAFGWSLNPQRNGRPIVWHNGSAGTFYAHLQIDRDSELVIAIVCNAGPTNQPHIEAAAQAIAELVSR